YAAEMARARTRSWVPSLLSVQASARRYQSNGDYSDFQFAADRLLVNLNPNEARVMVWASWRLPDLVYTPESVPLMPFRVPYMNEAVRERIVKTVHRNYGELERVHERLKRPPEDLYTRVIYQLRADELEAIVNVASGGYLSRWRQQQGR